MLDYKFKIGEIKIIKQYQDIDWKKNNVPAQRRGPWYQDH
jgi:hypothetical protein